MLLCGAFSCASLPARAAAAGAPTGFTLLTYNTNGLPRGLSFPRRRLPAIGRRANAYDIVAVQEVFGSAGRLAKEMPGKYAVAGGGLDGDSTKVLLRTVLLPFTFLLPDFRPPFGSGLYTFVDHRLLAEGGACAPSDVGHHAYRQCHGVFRAGTDWFARKGYLRVGVVAAEGVAIDVYNTHLDAGSDEGSRDARWTQFKELACAIDAASAARPVIVAGDLNSSYGRRGDRQPMEAFREHLGLADTGAGAEDPHWRERDYILYRDGDGARLLVDAAGEDRGFTRDGRALSDHPALFARFRVEPIPFGRRATPAPERRFDCRPANGSAS